MNVQLDLPVGKWRDLSKQEIEEINRLCATSSKTIDSHL